MEMGTPYKMRRPVMAKGHMCGTVNLTGCGLPIPTGGNELFNDYFYFLALVSTQSTALSSSNQYIMHPVQFSNST